MATPQFDLGLSDRIPRATDIDAEITLYLPESTTTAAANSAVLAASDEVRWRLWQTDGSVLVTVTDSTASANGSTITINTRGTASTTPAKVTLSLHSGDTDQAVGSYRWMVDVKDVSDSDRWIVACHGTLEIVDSPA